MALATNPVCMQKFLWIIKTSPQKCDFHGHINNLAGMVCDAWMHSTLITWTNYSVSNQRIHTRITITNTRSTMSNLDAIRQSEVTILQVQKIQTGAGRSQSAQCPCVNDENAQVPSQRSCWSAYHIMLSCRNVLALYQKWNIRKQRERNHAMCMTW